jgi:phytoene synthase
MSSSDSGKDNQTAAGGCGDRQLRNPPVLSGMAYVDDSAISGVGGGRPGIGSGTASRKPCESIQQHSRSFSFASRLLPADRRADVERLYAWCRWCDDGVDAASSPAAAAEFVDLATEDLRLIAAGKEPATTESRWFASIVRRYNLPIEAAAALLLGMQSDLTPAVDFSEDDLMRYCFRVAGTVGVLMCPILGLQDHRFLPHAAALGMGMQLTNIARDVAEDWRRERCYLPVEWTAGLRPSGTPPDHERVETGVRRILNVADGYYVAGRMGINALDSRCRLAVRAAASIYHAIGTKIRSRGFRVLDERARVSAIEKLRLFVFAAVENASKNSSLNPNEASTRSLTTAADLLLEHGVSL